MIVAGRSVNIAGAALLGAGLIATSTVTPVHLAAPPASITAGPITAAETTTDRNEGAAAAVDAEISDVSESDPAPRRTSDRAAKTGSDITAGPKRPRGGFDERPCRAGCFGGGDRPSSYGVLGRR